MMFNHSANGWVFGILIHANQSGCSHVMRISQTVMFQSCMAQTVAAAAATEAEHSVCADSSAPGQMPQPQGVSAVSQMVNSR